MSEKIDNTITKLSSLGLTEQEGEIYLAILQGRGDTALPISRHLGLARTKVYRLLDSLISKKMVITKLGDRGSRFLATPPDDLSIILEDRQHKLDQLKSSLPSLQDTLASLASSTKDSSQVLYYHNLDGIKQITYNSLRAKGELLTYELGLMDSFMSHAEAEKLRDRFVDNKINIRTLTNLVKMDAWTDNAEMVSKYWEIRHLPPQGKPFQFEILIYNDVYCLYRYTEGVAFAVEIHSQELADMQRQLFEYLWSGAKPFQVIDNHGTAKLI